MSRRWIAGVAVAVVAGLGLLAGGVGGRPAPNAEELEVSWRIPPEDWRPGRVTARTRRLRIEYLSGDCELDGRPDHVFRRAEVRRSRRRIVITVLVAKPPSRPAGTVCPSIGLPVVKTVDLRGRLGRRKLLDGSYDPPRRVSRPRPAARG